MSPDRLRELWREIALIMGHRPNRLGYPRRMFVDDLNSLHSGLIPVHRDGRDSQLKHIFEGRDPVPAYWDKVVHDLYERAITAETDPPTTGPLWTGWALTSIERMRAGRKLRDWRLAKGLTLNYVAEVTGLNAPLLVKFELRKQLIRPHELVQLAKGLNIDLFTLTGNEP